MECANHPGVEPRARCVSCGKLLCVDCMVESGGRMYCAECTPYLVGGRRPVTSLGRWFEGLELARAFSFLLDDTEWIRRFLVGCALLLGSFLVVPLLIVLGYQVQLLRSVAGGEDMRLPAWDRLRVKLAQGAELLLVSLFYALPLIIVLGATITLGIAAGGGVHGALRGLAVLLFMLGWVLTVGAALAFMLVMPAAAGRLAVTGRMREAFMVGTVLATVRANIRQFTVVLLVSVLLFSFLAPLGLVACCIGGTVTWLYSLLVTAHLYGQLAALGGERRD